MQRLTSTVHEKIWGSALTEPWLHNPKGLKIGEVWFAAPEFVPLLVKLLFTDDKLSVQVHPPDEYAASHGYTCGKTEMWHVLRAEPDAKIALGLREAVTKERLEAASLSGEVPGLLNWIPARGGDTFFIPAGTIHAIGSGLVLCEVQQFSDVTYRLFDYGRLDEDGNPRELHLADSLAVAELQPADGAVARKPRGNGLELLAQCKYFETERLTVRGAQTLPARARNTLYVALEGAGTIGGHPFRPGAAWAVPGSSEPLEIASDEAVFLITSEPSSRLSYPSRETATGIR